MSLLVQISSVYLKESFFFILTNSLNKHLVKLKLFELKLTLGLGGMNDKSVSKIGLSFVQGS
jgi:hypothetical protein